MALTFRSNGVAGGLVSSAWWNDFYSLLTGSMTDQPVSIKNSLTLKAPLGKPSAPGLALASGTNLGIGVYGYGFTQVNSDGAESPLSTTASITTTTGNQKVSVSSITAGTAGISTRNLYRTKVGGSVYYFLATISDNTTTTYTDTTADGSLGNAAPLDFALGGLQFVDNGGFLQGWITSTSGRIGLTALHNFTFYANGYGNEVLYVDNTGTTVYPGQLTVGAGISSGAANITIGNTNLSYSTLTFWGSYLGIKNGNGVKFAEFKSTGNFTIFGTQLQTTNSSISTASGQPFDSFDVGEVFECDQEYPSGTVVCPGVGDKLTRCTHENCHAAMVVSHSPGLGLGVNDHPNGIHYVALAGRVSVRTAQDIAPRSLVVSDGRGGVRAVRPGEPSFVLGFTLNQTAVVDSHPQVGVFLRSMFVILKG